MAEQLEIAGLSAPQIEQRVRAAYAGLERVQSGRSAPDSAVN